MMLQQYLRINDTEVANALRTLTYLRRGLGGPMRWVRLADTLVPEGGGYTDIYDDVYEADPFRTENLACYCRTIDTGPYQSPDFDEAPWWDPDVPESADFLGLLAEIRLAPIAKRQVGRRQWGGANIGPVVSAPRVVQVRGPMFAASAAGMAYGERWLAQVLAGSSMGCAGDVLTVLPACPPDDETDGSSALRELADIGIIDGPTFTPAGSNAECRVEDVAFQLVAGMPWLRKVTTLDVVDPDADPITSTQVDAGLVADAAVVLTFEAGASALAGVTVTGRTGACGFLGPAEVEFEVNGVPPFSTLVVDASRRSVEVRDVGGTVIGSFDYLLFDGLFEYLIVRAGTRLCVTIDAGGATGTSGSAVTLVQVDLEY